MENDSQPTQADETTKYTEKQVDQMLESIIRDLSTLLDSAPQDDQGTDKPVSD